MKVVKIKWRDSRQIHGWCLLEDITEDSCVIDTVGFLIKETELDYVVALSVGENPPQANGINVIPKCCVIEIIK